MEPIDLRVDTTYSQALRCVQYRLPKPQGFKPPGYVLALGVRYGMIGMAASHHLLITADDCEERMILDMVESWPRLVEDHVRWDMSHRLPISSSSTIPHLIGRIAAMPINAYLPLYRRLCPISRALELVAEALTSEHKAMIYEGWPLFRRKAAMRQFRQNVEESAEFAMHFFERRQADIEEVPEIVLIGE